MSRFFDWDITTSICKMVGFIERTISTGIYSGTGVISNILHGRSHGTLYHRIGLIGNHASGKVDVNGIPDIYIYQKPKLFKRSSWPI